MSKKKILEIVSDPVELEICANLTEEAFEECLENEDFFSLDSEYVDYIPLGAFSEIRLTDEDGENERDIMEEMEEGGTLLCIDDLTSEEYQLTFADGYVYYGRSDQGNEIPKPERKEMCETLLKMRNEKFQPIKELAPNSVTIIMKWEMCEDCRRYALELDDDEEFDLKNLALVANSFVPEWLKKWSDEESDDSCLDDLFVGEIRFQHAWVYKGKICDAWEDGFEGDNGGPKVVSYAIRTDDKGKVVSIEEI